MSEEENTFQVANFSGKRGEDFALWKMRMQAVLVGKELFDTVGALEQPSGSETPE